MHKRPNRLINEKSPYLLQHAYNPVDWRPWGDAAFDKAERENKPILLSIGYSTCHWCHVMERESFEDDDVATLLNDHFVAVKVDREERPDVDHIYMDICQALTGSGGWPLTVFLTPDKKPFFAGTYFPKESKWGRPGLMDILQNISRQWRYDQLRLMQYGDDIIQSMSAHLSQKVGSGGLSYAQLDHAYAELEKYFDGEYGGFSSAPKFPTPHNLLFLLRYWRRTGKPKCLAMVEKTLLGMRQGGIYDHLGFGFCRYSTDHKWLVPHFEKMLYDNALLCYAYLEAYQATENKEYATVAEEIIEYVLRDMTNSEGAFYSAEDADSEGLEGLFYLWTKQEIIDALGWEHGCIFADYYHVTEDGNFEHGKSIIHSIHRDPGEYAAKLHMKQEELASILANGREKLYLLRENRTRPFKDDKILTSWNALMIIALAKAGNILDRPDYVQKAKAALSFIETHLVRDDGRILARYRDGQAAFPAYLDDYAFLLWSHVELYAATFDMTFLSKAKRLAENLLALFQDQNAGGFFFTGKDAEQLIIRPKEFYDGAMPSGNAVAVFALLRLARLTGDNSLLAPVEAVFSTFGKEVKQAPRAYVFFLLALDLFLEPPQQIVIAGERNHSLTQSMLKIVRSVYLPEITLLLNEVDVADDEGVSSFSSLEGRHAIAGQTTAYICVDAQCSPPIFEQQTFKGTIEKLASTHKQ